MKYESTCQLVSKARELLIDESIIEECLSTANGADRLELLVEQAEAE